MICEAVFMPRRYDKRNLLASGITNSVIDGQFLASQTLGVLTKIELVQAAIRAAGTQAAVAALLELPPPRITEMLKGDRGLTFDEARRLVQKYNIDLKTGTSEAPAPAPSATISAADAQDLEKLLAAILSKLDRDQLPVREWPRILAGIVQTWLSPEKIDPAKARIRPPRLRAGSPKASRPGAASKAAR